MSPRRHLQAPAACWRPRAPLCRVCAALLGCLAVVAALAAPWEAHAVKQGSLRDLNKIQEELGERAGLEYETLTAEHAEHFMTPRRGRKSLIVGVVLLAVFFLLAVGHPKSLPGESHTEKLLPKARDALNQRFKQGKLPLFEKKLGKNALSGPLIMFALAALLVVSGALRFSFTTLKRVTERFRNGLLRNARYLRLTDLVYVALAVLGVFLLLSGAPHARQSFF